MILRYTYVYGKLSQGCEVFFSRLNLINLFADIRTQYDENSCVWLSL